MNPDGPDRAPAPRPRGETDRPLRPGGFAADLADKMRRSTAPAPGRGIVIGLVAAAVLVATILQFTVFRDSGPAAGVRRTREADERKALLAPPAPGSAVPGGEDPGSAPGPAPGAPPGPPPLLPSRGVPAPPAGTSPLPAPSPAAATPGFPGSPLDVPPGIPEWIAGRLRLDLSGTDMLRALVGQRQVDLERLAQAQMMAESGIRDLPDLLAAAPSAERPALRAFVIDRLAELVASPRVGTAALDAALRIAAADPAGLEPVNRAAREIGLAEPETTVSALLLLEVAPEAERAPAVAAVLEVARSPGRPLHVRILAARTLAQWGAAAEERRTLAADPATPAPLAEALR